MLSDMLMKLLVWTYHNCYDSLLTGNLGRVSSCTQRHRRVVEFTQLKCVSLGVPRRVYT